MKTLDKQFDYKTYRFNITVTLNVKSERHPGGKVFHEIRTNDMGPANYYNKELVEESQLLNKISEHEKLAKEYVDGRDPTNVPPLIQSLFGLGFR